MRHEVELSLFHQATQSQGQNQSMSKNQHGNILVGAALAAETAPVVHVEMHGRLVVVKQAKNDELPPFRRHGP